MMRDETEVGTCAHCRKIHIGPCATPPPSTPTLTPERLIAEVEQVILASAHLDTGGRSRPARVVMLPADQINALLDVARRAARALIQPEPETDGRYLFTDPNNGDVWRIRLTYHPDEPFRFELVERGNVLRGDRP